jgi:hypothetical protein
MKAPFRLRSIKIAILMLSFTVLSAAGSMAYDPSLKLFGGNLFYSPEKQDPTENQDPPKNQDPTENQDPPKNQDPPDISRIHILGNF